MLGCEPNRDQLEQPLDGPDPYWRAGHMIEQHQPAAWPQDALHFRYRAALIRDGAQ